MYSLKDLLIKCVNMQASDLHIIEGAPPVLRVNGDLIKLGEEKMESEDIKNIVHYILKNNISKYERYGDFDTAFELEDVGRFRVNIFKEKRCDALALRVLKSKIPTLDEIYFPKVVKEFTKENRGLILVTGQTGCGKSTTLASMIEEINRTRACHIITLEDPIEYIYEYKKSIISQREIGKDTRGFDEGLNAALREDPDVILIGEMRDLSTIKTAITAAETGHLVLSTLHTSGACESIDRIINVFPKEGQEEIKIQLSGVLKGVIYQKLIKTKDNKGRRAAYEIMKVVPAIRKLIRDGKTYLIPSLIETGKKYGMITMDMCITSLYKDGFISREDALNNSSDKNLFEKSY